jgi:hypothetical protein
MTCAEWLSKWVVIEVASLVQESGWERRGV